MPERRYSETHEWVSVDSGVATVGISDFAQAQLGDVVFLELPPVGARITAGATFGVIESVKAASDLYAPLTGRVVEVNPRVADDPEVVNKDPLGEGWLLKVEPEGELPETLLDEAGYAKASGAGH